MRHFFLLTLSFFMLSQTANAASSEKSLVRPCAACHGYDGRSMNPAWPHLAGQQADYLSKQIMDLKLGKTRHVDPGMAPFIANLTDEDIETLAAYYASKPKPYGSHKLRAKRPLGEALYHEGSPKRHILACVSCHGYKASGNGLPGFPSLKGQQVDYIIKQLKAFKSGERHNDLGQSMHNITQNMTEDEMTELAVYLASLHKDKT